MYYNITADVVKRNSCQTHELFLKRNSSFSSFLQMIIKIFFLFSFLSSILRQVRKYAHGVPDHHNNIIHTSYFVPLLFQNSAAFWNDAYLFHNVYTSCLSFCYLWVYILYICLSYVQFNLIVICMFYKML